MSFMMVEFIQFYFFFQLLLTRLTGIFNFFSRSNLSNSDHSKNPVEKKTHDSRLSKSHLFVMGDDLELLMADLGVSCHPGCEKLPEVLNSTYIYNVFEAEQPRLDEVKEAFDVFDENKDGFIDAGELQRVVSVMGLKERVDVEDCRKMIGVFDENADGRIDFDEFVKFMEKAFC